MAYIPRWAVIHRELGWLNLDVGEIAFSIHSYLDGVVIFRTKRDCNKMIAFLCRQHGFFEGDLEPKKF